MSEDDELAREEAYIAKITAKKNQAFEKKVFGGGLEAARTPGSAKFGGGLEAARAASGTGGSAKFGGGLEAARAQAGLAGTSKPELRGGLEAARTQAGISAPGPVYTHSTPTPTPVYSAPAPAVTTPVHTPSPAPPANFSLPPLQSEVVELTMDLPLPVMPPQKYVLKLCIRLIKKVYLWIF